MVYKPYTSACHCHSSAGRLSPPSFHLTLAQTRSHIQFLFIVMSNYCEVCRSPSFLQCTRYVLELNFTVSAFIHRSSIRCHIAWYCSTACQSAAWPTHYASCVPATPGPAPHLPAESVTLVQALVLPANSGYYMTSVKIEGRVGSNGVTRWTPDFDPNLNLGALPCNMTAVENGFLGTFLTQHS